MALSHRPGDRAEASGDIAVLLHQRRQTAISRHAPHHDRVVDHLARLVKDLLDAEVDIAAEPTVELDFLATDRLAALWCAEVDEGEPHRLLALVHEIPVEDE